MVTPLAKWWIAPREFGASLRHNIPARIGDGRARLGFSG
jgi:hypothetical protein